jgi:hypothetical protein
MKVAIRSPFLLIELDTSLPAYACNRSSGYVFGRVWHGYAALLGCMFELHMAALFRNLTPAIGFESLDDLGA